MAPAPADPKRLAEPRAHPARMGAPARGAASHSPHGAPGVARRSARSLRAPPPDAWAESGEPSHLPARAQPPVANPVIASAVETSRASGGPGNSGAFAIRSDGADRAAPSSAR